MHKPLTLLLLVFISVFVGGCGETKEQKAEKIFSQAQQHYDNGQYSSSKPLLTEYNSLLFNGPHKKQVDQMLQRISFVEKNEKLINAALAKLQLSNSNAISYDIVDTWDGSALQTVALHVTNPTKESIVLSLDKFDKQATGRYLIYFVKDSDYQLLNRKELAYKVLAVYASTSGLLQFLDSNGDITEEIKMF